MEGIGIRSGGGVLGGGGRVFDLGDYMSGEGTLHPNGGVRKRTGCGG